MEIALASLRAGRAVVIDDAFGAGTAHGIAHAAAQLLSSGRLRADSVHLDGEFSGALAAQPSLWDSLRLTTLLGADAEHPALAHAIRSLAAAITALSAAELESGTSMSAAWPARGLADMPIALLAVTGFNGTRYALHCDSQSEASRKVTLTYYPGSGGGALRVLEGDRRQPRRIEPRADRLVIFDSDWPHEVVPSRTARLSLTMWGFGNGERLRPPPTRREHDTYACTSDFCRRAVEGRIRSS